uniref:Uncharacterized protein n=1 Tax=Octopus bimaculoides TaxID=37653 RepID=A0A0L8FM12_OCTBM
MTVNCTYCKFKYISLLAVKDVLDFSRTFLEQSHFLLEIQCNSDSLSVQELVMAAICVVPAPVPQ